MKSLLPSIAVERWVEVIRAVSLKDATIGAVDRQFNNRISRNLYGGECLNNLRCNCIFWIKTHIKSICEVPLYVK